MEEHSTGLAARIDAAVDTHSVQLLTTAAVELEHLEAGRDEPDVGEGDVGEFTAPFHGDTDTTEESVDHVTQVLPAVEAFVGEFPHTVHGVSTFGLGEDVLECDLKMIIRKIFDHCYISRVH